MKIYILFICILILIVFILFCFYKLVKKSKKHSGDIKSIQKEYFYFFMDKPIKEHSTYIEKIIIQCKDFKTLCGYSTDTQIFTISEVNKISKNQVEIIIELNGFGKGYLNLYHIGSSYGCSISINVYKPQFIINNSLIIYKEKYYNIYDYLPEYYNNVFLRYINKQNSNSFKIKDGHYLYGLIKGMYSVEVLNSDTMDSFILKFEIV